MRGPIDRLVDRIVADPARSERQPHATDSTLDDAADPYERVVYSANEDPTEWAEYVDMRLEEIPHLWRRQSSTESSVRRLTRRSSHNRAGLVAVGLAAIGVSTIALNTGGEATEVAGPSSPQVTASSVRTGTPAPQPLVPSTGDGGSEPTVAESTTSTTRPTSTTEAPTTTSSTTTSTTSTTVAEIVEDRSIIIPAADWASRWVPETDDDALTRDDDGAWVAASWMGYPAPGDGIWSILMVPAKLDAVEQGQEVHIGGDEWTVWDVDEIPASDQTTPHQRPQFAPEGEPMVVLVDWVSRTENADADLRPIVWLVKA